MNLLNSGILSALLVLLTLSGCSTRPINARISEFEPGKGYQVLARQHDFKDPANLVVLAFSGGGTRAAAFYTACSRPCGAPNSRDHEEGCD